MKKTQSQAASKTNFEEMSDRIVPRLSSFIVKFGQSIMYASREEMEKEGLFVIFEYICGVKIVNFYTFQISFF